MKVQTKYELFKNAYLGFDDLEREIKLTITKNMTEREMDIVISDLNDRIGLLIGSGVPTVSLNSNESLEPIHLRLSP